MYAIKKTNRRHRTVLLSFRRSIRCRTVQSGIVLLRRSNSRRTACGDIFRVRTHFCKSLGYPIRFILRLVLFLCRERRFHCRIRRNGVDTADCVSVFSHVPCRQRKQGQISLHFSAYMHTDIGDIRNTLGHNVN